MNNLMLSALLLAIPLLCPRLAWPEIVTLAKIDSFLSDNCSKKQTIPLADQPKNDEKESLNCEPSEEYYYGFNRPIDYAKARKCAVIEMENGDGLVLGGSSILMMIYANGNGVKPNLDIAISLACELEGAPAEKYYRLLHLKQLQRAATSAEKKPFDICDDVTSKNMIDLCIEMENYHPKKVIGHSS